MPPSVLRPIKTKLLHSDSSLSKLGGIKLAGTIHSNRGFKRSRMRTLGAYAMVYLLAGEGEYGDGLGHVHPVFAGDLLWLFPKVPHFYGPNAAGQWDEIYLVFEGPFFDFWHQQKLITPEHPIWHLEPVEYWFERIQSLAVSSRNTGGERAFLQLSSFQSLVADMELASHQGPSPDWLVSACSQLTIEGRSTPNLHDLARTLGMSYESFRKKFVRSMGIAPAKYRQARLIERACTLLMERSLSHKEIATRLGFCDEFHLSKVFRRRMGFSPQAFRLRALGVKEEHPSKAL